MSDAPVFRRNESTAKQIAAHLFACDVDFVPPLGGRVDIEAYAGKLAARADRFEAWAGGEMIGLVAAYCNDDRRAAAFITSVSVLSCWHGRGIASQLISLCIEYVQGLGYERLKLEVDSCNAAALGLYKRQGFSVECTNGRELSMFLEVQGNAYE